MVKVIIDDTLDDYHDVVNNLKCGDIIGAKGHLMNNITVSDRIQIF
jgi:lysyl-tRNA synthetase class II